MNVAVPDHMHFPIAYSAIQRGKHVYCQKPLCHDVAEVRALTQAAVQKGVVTQLGTQVASTMHERTAVPWLKEGRIGKVTHAYSARIGRAQSRATGSRVRGRKLVSRRPQPRIGTSGSAPRRRDPYAPDIYHPAKWRAWQDFGTGWSGDIGCHIFDPVWKGLGLDAPLTVTAEVQQSWKESAERRADTWPQGDHITWTFPGNERIAGKELVLEWFDGGLLSARAHPQALLRRPEGIPAGVLDADRH